MRTITITFDGEPYLPGLLRLIADHQVEQLEKLHPGESFGCPAGKVSLAEVSDAVPEMLVRDRGGAILGIDWRGQLGLPCSQKHAEAMSDGIPIDCPRCG